MQARYQDPLIGRFLSVDPVTFMDTGSPSYFNRYRYCSNDSVNCFDPTGMSDDDYTTRMTGRSAADSGKGLMSFLTKLSQPQSAGDGIQMTTTTEMDQAFGDALNGAASPGVNGLIALSDNVAMGGAVDAALDGNSVEAGARAALAIGVGRAGTAIGQTSRSSNMTTVGRWMSPIEAAKIQKTGLVQESTSGLTHVANPASASNFRRQAPSGSVYTQFSVPTSSLRPSGTGVSSIPGPNARIRPTSSMPAASNFRILESKP